MEPQDLDIANCDLKLAIRRILGNFAAGGEIRADRHELGVVIPARGRELGKKGGGSRLNKRTVAEVKVRVPGVFSMGNIYF